MPFAKPYDWLAQPLVRALLLSVALHAALIMTVRPASQGREATVVMHARIAPQAAEPQVRPPEPDSPPQVVPRQEDLAPASLQPPLTVPRADVDAQRPHTSPQVSASTTDAPLPEKRLPAGPTTASEPEPGGQGAERQQAANHLPSIPVMLDTQWYTAREVDVHPRALKEIRPTYPETARRQGIQGSVVLQLKIDQFGAVRDLEVIESDPPEVFDEVSLKAFESARFQPAMRDGRPVRSLVRIRVMFELD